jgi:hypothetical protein
MRSHHARSDAECAQLPKLWAVSGVHRAVCGACCLDVTPVCSLRVMCLGRGFPP